MLCAASAPGRTELKTTDEPNRKHAINTHSRTSGCHVLNWMVTQFSRVNVFCIGPLNQHFPKRHSYARSRRPFGLRHDRPGRPTTFSASRRSSWAAVFFFSCFFFKTFTSELCTPWNLMVPQCDTFQMFLFFPHLDVGLGNGFKWGSKNMLPTKSSREIHSSQIRLIKWFALKLLDILYVSKSQNKGWEGNSHVCHFY